MLYEILKQLADLKRLVCSYPRDLKNEQQEIEMLKRSHQSPIMEIGISHLNHVRQEQRGLKNAVLSLSPLRFRVDPSGTEESTESVADLNLETLAEIVRGRATGPANVEQPKSTETRRRILEPQVCVSQYRHR